jgi:hypothetical protein
LVKILGIEFFLKIHLNFALFSDKLKVSSSNRTYFPSILLLYWSWRLSINIDFWLYTNTHTHTHTHTYIYMYIANRKTTAKKRVLLLPARAVGVHVCYTERELQLGSVRQTDRVPHVSPVYKTFHFLILPILFPIYVCMCVFLCEDFWMMTPFAWRHCCYHHFGFQSQG